MHLCQFCNQEAKYQFKTGTYCCSSHINKCPARRKNTSQKSKGRIPWCKGQTKETDPRIKLASQKLKGKQKTEEHRKNISESKKGNIPWNKGLSSESDSRILSGERNGMYGQTHTEKTKELLRKLGKEGHFKGETNPWYGKKRNGKLSPRYRTDKDHKEYDEFRNKVYVLTESTYKKFKNEINPNDYPRGKSGVNGAYHLDHKISIAYGYENGWTPEQLSSKENLQMLPWRDNIVKHSKCKWE